MKQLLTIPEKWFRSFVFLLWLSVITGLLQSGKYILFLRPDFDILLGISIIILAGFLYSGSSSTQNKLSAGNLIKGFILILPLLYISNADNNGLGSSSLEKRMSGLPKITMKEKKPEDIKLIEQPTSGTPAKKITILDIYRDMDKYQGSRVSVSGMLSHNKKVKEIYGQKAVVLFRFSVNCCAADAIPYALIIKNADMPESEETIWVNATGVFYLEEINKEMIPVLNNTILKKVKVPESPFLF